MEYSIQATNLKVTISEKDGKPVIVASMELVCAPDKAAGVAMLKKPLTVSFKSAQLTLPE